MSRLNLFVSLLTVASGFMVPVAFAIAATRSAERKVAELRARGLYPASGKESMEDVVRLLNAGEKVMAIRCYRALHAVGLREAKIAVELLENKA